QEVRGRGRGAGSGSARPSGGVAGPWSHLAAAARRILPRDAGHGPERLRCRIMTGMSAPLHAPDAPAATLFVRTQRIEDPVDLLEHVPAEVSGAWIRHGQGVVAL